MDKLSIFPPSASSFAPETDLLYVFLVVVSAAMTLLIFGAIFYFALRYRRRSEDEQPPPIHGSVSLEVLWSVVPFLAMLVMFAWGTELYFDRATPPADALDVYVTGKQWMWKIQYPDGQREINELHVPRGKAVRLTLTSEDVIHSFYIPSFRVKHDVVPGRYQTIWFQATKVGRYHLLCAEYCGTGHSRMTGWVTVMDPVDYQSWLTGVERGGSMVAKGAQLFQDYGCVSCHATTREGRGPPLVNVFGHSVMLSDGRTVLADEAYIRESILDPGAKVVEGYPNVMPVFQGQLNEEQLLQLVVYVKSLAEPQSEVDR